MCTCSVTCECKSNKCLLKYSPDANKKGLSSQLKYKKNLYLTLKYIMYIIRITSVTHCQVKTLISCLEDVRKDDKWAPANQKGSRLYLLLSCQRKISLKCMPSSLCSVWQSSKSRIGWALVGSPVSHALNCLLFCSRE